MSERDAVHGLACPNCGGVVPIPEGQLIVLCPYCEMRSMVRGERGLSRYQVSQRVDQDGARSAWHKFLKSSRAIAGGTSKQAHLEEILAVYLPFWTTWARVLGWFFGEEEVGSGDDRHYEPREIKIVEEMVWNEAACDVGEFGVEKVRLKEQSLEVFDADKLHSEGLVFEPIGSLSDAKASAEGDFKERLHKIADLDRISQAVIRFTRQRMGLVYYPLWVTRYLYRGRSFQVVVDGYTGQVLYGKAPGSTTYRAAILVGGMALGALVTVDVSALAFYLGLTSNGDDVLGFIAGGLVIIGVGIGIMRAAYRKFRYGEQYEYRLRVDKGRHRTRRKEKGIYRAREVTS